MLKFAVIFLFILATSKPASAQVSDDIEQCINNKIAAKRKNSSHVASDDRYQAQQFPSDQPFKNGDEYRLIAFFECHGVKLSGKFNQQGVFDRSEAMAGLRIAYSTYQKGSRLKYVDVVHDDNSIEYLPSEDAYALHISDFFGQHINQIINMTEEPNPENLFVKKTYQLGIGVDRHPLEDEILRLVDLLYNDRAFVNQGGSVKSVSFSTHNPLDSERHTYAEKQWSGYNVFLGKNTESNEPQALYQWLANPSSLRDRLKALGITVDFSSRIFGKHISFLNSVVEQFHEKPSISHISLNKEDYQISYLTGNCTASGDCSGVELSVSKETDDKVDPNYILGESASQILTFFAGKSVSMPDRFSQVTIQNLTIIGRQWSDRLRIKKIALTDSDNSIKRRGFEISGRYNEVDLNENHPFDGYTELINDFYFP